jgi:hypothetical protein
MDDPSLGNALQSVAREHEEHATFLLMMCFDFLAMNRLHS